MTNEYPTPQPGMPVPPTPVQLGEETLDETCEWDPQLLVTFAVLAICHSEHAVSCGLSVSTAGRAPETIAATDDVPVRVDWLQHELQQGPAVGPVHSQIVVCKDLGADERWPDFGRMCVAVLGLRSMISIEVPVPGISTTLNFYSSEPSAFDHFDVDAALRLARLAAEAIHPAIEHARTAQVAASGSDFSKVAVALGIVMAQYRVTSADGFAMLREASRDLRREMLDIAVEVVREGRLPDDEIIRVRRSRPATTAELPEVAAGVPAVGGPGLWRDPSPAPAEPVRPVERTRRRPRTRMPLALRRWVVQDAAGMPA